MEAVDLVLSGSGTLLPCHIGAVEYLRLLRRQDIQRVAGTSGGALVAAGIAHDMSTTEMITLCEKFFGSKMLDPQLLIFRGWGLHRGDKIFNLLQKFFPGKMKDAKIPWGVFVVDVESKQPLWISNTTHPDVLVADAVMASISIPLFFRMRKIRGLTGSFVDGGTATNFGLGVWDDVPERRTVGIRFRGEHKKTVVRGPISYLMSLLSVLIDNANQTYISKKRYADVIEIHSRGDSLEFNLTHTDIRARRLEGWVAAREFYARQSD